MKGFRRESRKQSTHKLTMAQIKAGSENPGDKPYLNEGGFLDFGPKDAANPRSWPKSRRWAVTLCASILTMNGNFASSITSGSLNSITKEFKISEVAAALTTTLFLLGYCFGPFVFAPLSEYYGRKCIFRITHPLYMAFSFLCAFAPTFWALLLGRLLCGILMSATLTISPSIISDMWDGLERGNAMAIFSNAVWIGPCIGPIVSGCLALDHDWRWGFYVVLCCGGLVTPLMLIIPETYGPTILTTKAKSMRKENMSGYESVQSEFEASKSSVVEIFKDAASSPWSILFDPICFLCSLYMAIVFTLQYMLFGIYPIVFQDMRGWNKCIGQMPLIAVIIGSIPAGLAIFWDTRRMNRKQKLGNKIEPEDRLFPSMLGGLGFAAAMFWFAWTAQSSTIHWILPTTAGFFLSASLLLVFVTYTDYTIETYASRAASVMAANNLLRSTGSAAAPLFTTQMFHGLGVAGGGSLIAGVASLMAVIPFVFYKRGRTLRNRSKYAKKDNEPPEASADEKRDASDPSRATQDEESG